MEYLVTFIAPIVRQRSAHQCFVLSREGYNENIVRLSSDSDDLKEKKTRHSVSLQLCCYRKLLSFFMALTIIDKYFFIHNFIYIRKRFFTMLRQKSVHVTKLQTAAIIIMGNCTTIVSF